MSTIAIQTLEVMSKLDEASQVTVLRFAKFLAEECDDDVAMYDAAKAEDDGYRVTAEDLRAKYGI